MAGLVEVFNQWDIGLRLGFDSYFLSQSNKSKNLSTWQDHYSNQIECGKKFEISAISYMKAMYNAKLVRMTIFIYVIKAIEMAHLFGANIWFEKKKRKKKKKRKNLLTTPIN